MSEDTSAQTAGGATPAAPAAGSVPDVKSLPEWAQTIISDVRKEAAQYRVDRNEARDTARQEIKSEYEQRIADLESAESEAKTTISERELDIIKLKASLVQLIGDEAIEERVTTFSGLLHGSNEDEIRSHAEEVKKLFATTDAAAATQRQAATDQSQGRQNHIPLNGDPLLNALKAKVGVR